VLYELLTGRMPYRLRSRLFHEIVRVVSEEPPIRPSTAVTQSSKDADAPTTAHLGRLRQSSPSDLSRRLMGDLDGIVLKTLEKDPRDRYRSAASLSDDIERHLERRPVEARQASPGYRAGKFFGRNLPWAVLAATIVAGLATGAITIHWTGVVLIAGCLLAVAIWYAATDRAIGRRIAESEFLFAHVPAWAILSSMIILVWIRPFAVMYAIISPIIVRQAIGWFTRGRSAGSLVLDITLPRWRRYPRAYCLLPGVAVIQAFDVYHGFPPAYYFAAFLGAGLVFWLNGRVEIRSRGIMYVGRLYTWENIESYDWREDPDWLRRRAKGRVESLLVLRLRLRRSLHFLPPARILILESRRAEVDAIMQRYLSDWPGTPESIPTE